MDADGYTARPPVPAPCERGQYMSGMLFACLAVRKPAMGLSLAAPPLAR